MGAVCRAYEFVRLLACKRRGWFQCCSPMDPNFDGGVERGAVYQLPERDLVRGMNRRHGVECGQCPVKR